MRNRPTQGHRATQDEDYKTNKHHLKKEEKVKFQTSLYCCSYATTLNFKGKLFGHLTSISTSIWRDISPWIPQWYCQIQHEQCAQNLLGRRSQAFVWKLKKKEKLKWKFQLSHQVDTRLTKMYCINTFSGICKESVERLTKFSKEFRRKLYMISLFFHLCVNFLLWWGVGSTNSWTSWCFQCFYY